MDNWFTIDRVDDNTYIISEYRHWEETHCYLLNGSERSLLIDTGLGISNIYDEVIKFTNKPITAVATHIHWDHIGGHQYFPDFYAHAGELDWLNGKFPLSMETIRKMVIDRCDLPNNFNVYDYELFQGMPTKIVADHDVIDIGGRQIEVLHTPGHSPGHLCFWEKDKGYLFTGDLIYKDILFAYYPSTDPEAYLASLKKIDTVKQSDAKEWAIRMNGKGYSYKTIDNYKRSLKASFYMAIQDDCIRKNPFHFKLSDVLEDDTEAKVILTPEQEEKLLAFMETDNVYSKYRDEVILLLETGLRISELCGLTTHIDMPNRVINIDHQLLRDTEVGYYISTPKTKNGKRELPLTERAYQALERILKNRGKAQPLVVDGYSNFLFLNREGLPKVAGNYESMVRGLIKKYNKIHKDKLPNITPHSFRHTYCTNMANKGMNPNTLQYIMGHANITMTLGYYAHGTFQSAKAELERLAS
ncbi:hypothetical protein C4024_18630 [Clostridioides difficile]|nr:hypothetical protein [Clostridioides difficile]